MTEPTAMQRLFLRTLDRNLRRAVEIRLPGQTPQRVGSGEAELDWTFHDRRAPARIFLYPDLALGETYMDGAWDSDNPAELLSVLMESFPERQGRLARFASSALDWLRPNLPGRSRRNVASHYDLDEALFRTFLDSDLQYSCAYFAQPAMDLEQAQRAKCLHIANKLLLQAGQRVLDIGSGWGGLAIRLAQETGVEVTGLTLSVEQQRVATRRAREQGLDGRVRFRLQDYRDETARYDRIVSVGMFEHVGRAHHAKFFKQVHKLLAPDGVALIHSIGTFNPGSRNPWIQRYIFPGGRIPTLAEMSGASGAAGLVTADVEVWRVHYARTLEHWRQRFENARKAVIERFGERFFRMWVFYLASCEAAFRARGMSVFQFQLAHRLDAVPVTRGYLYPQSN